MLISELQGYCKIKNNRAAIKLTQLDQLIRTFILDYNQRIHPSIPETPKTRWEKQGFLPNMPTSIEQLDLLLLTIAKPRKVQRDGIRFQGLRYLDPVLANYIGESIMIRYDPRDITYLRVFHHDNYLCQPICQVLDNQSISLKDIQLARDHRRRELQKNIKQRLSLVDAILISKSRDSPREESIQSIEKRSQSTSITQSTKLKLYSTDE